MKKKTINSGSHPNPAPNRNGTADHVNYKSPDGLVEIVTKRSGAKRYPKHDYPIVCLHLRPKPGTRVQLLEDGSGGLDVLLCHPEVRAHLLALNAADSKAGYHAPEIQAKPAERKRRWDEINQARHSKRRGNSDSQ